MKQLLKQFNLIHGKSSPKPESLKATKSEQGQDELIILKKYALFEPQWAAKPAGAHIRQNSG
jgi:hypothetical protein